jgi:hypothetical protein
MNYAVLHIFHEHYTIGGPKTLRQSYTQNGAHLQTHQHPVEVHRTPNFQGQYLNNHAIRISEI